MATLINLSDKIISAAKTAGEIYNRSVEQQIEHWIKIGKISEENPDLTYNFIKKIVTSRQEAKKGYVTLRQAQGRRLEATF